MSTQEQRRQWRMGVERMRGDLHWDFAYHATDVLLIEVEQLQQERDALAAELERVRGENERLLDDATARIGYSEYLRNGGGGCRTGDG